jgi:hypothetical protein
MLLTVQRLAKENAELFEEVQQLRAAVNVYRELSERKGALAEKRSPLGSVSRIEDELDDPCQSVVA